MTFEYAQELTELKHINVRTETHGEDKVNALDLRFSFETTNQCLAMFSPTLKSCLYAKEDSTQQELTPDLEHLTVVRNPQMGVLKWDLKYENARFVVHHGSDGREDIVFGDAKINKFTIEPKQGGTVIVGFRVQVHPDEMQTARLMGVLGQEVYVTVDPEGGDDPDDGQPDLGASGNNGYAPDAAPTDEQLYASAKDFVYAEGHVDSRDLEGELLISADKATELLKRLQDDDVISAPDADGVHTVVVVGSRQRKSRAAAPAATVE